MPKKTKSIPVNKMADDSAAGIAIERIILKKLPHKEQAKEDSFEEGKQSHRHDRHSFFLLESGTVHIEIDFKKYKIRPSSVIYIHPDQVHRVIAFDKAVVSSWAIKNENLNAEYLQLLETITPAKPLLLKKTTFSVMCEAVSLCIKFFQQQGNKLYHSILKDSCNALVALVAAEYLAQSKSTNKLSRFGMVTKAFKKILEHNYVTIKSPAAYAQQLNISTPYLNECVKNTTGYPVSYHIQQRIILEAKRLLYHSDQSVKEIAAELGYDDYSYFSRLFTKITGVTAVTFRSKNRD